VAQVLRLRRVHLGHLLGGEARLAVLPALEVEERRVAPWKKRETPVGGSSGLERWRRGREGSGQRRAAEKGGMGGLDGIWRSGVLNNGICGGGASIRSGEGQRQLRVRVCTFLLYRWLGPRRNCASVGLLYSLGPCDIIVVFYLDKTFWIFGLIKSK
jgi:hypothetical protein